MKKISFIFLMLAVIIAGCTTSPSEEIDVAQISNLSNQEENSLDIQVTTKKVILDQSFFEFEGFGPGSSHTGTFDNIDLEVYLNENNEFLGSKGTIYVDSVNTGIGGLDSHLKRNDFFDAQTYPQINIEILRIENQMAITNLEFRGVTKEITFPVTLSESSISSEFVLDTTPYNMSNTRVNKDVRIAFELVY